MALKHSKQRIDAIKQSLKQDAVDAFIVVIFGAPVVLGVAYFIKWLIS